MIQKTRPGKESRQVRRPGWPRAGKEGGKAMEFRPIRRNRQQLTQEQAWALLEQGSYGVLAVQGDSGWPYAVPLNYVCQAGSIYFHCAKAGHKLDAMRAHPQVCFTVVGKSDVVSSKFTTYFSSVVAFGTARVVEENSARLVALRALVEKYSPHEPEENKAHEVDSCGTSCIVAIDVVHLTGKQAIELVEQ